MPPIVSNEMSRSRYGEGPGEGDAMSPPSRGSAPCRGSRLRVKVAPEGGDAHDEHAPLTPEQTIFCGTPKGLRLLCQAANSEDLSLSSAALRSRIIRRCTTLLRLRLRVRIASFLVCPRARASA